MSQFQVQKDVALRAAQNAKRCVLKSRMRFLRQAALDELAPSRIAVVFRRILGLPSHQESTEKEIRDAMRRFCHDGDWHASYKIAGWGIYGQAKSLMAACRACCADTISLSRDDAEFVYKYQDDPGDVAWKN